MSSKVDEEAPPSQPEEQNTDDLPSSQVVVIAVPTNTAETPRIDKEASCMAISSLVLGIIAIFIFGIILGPLAVILGALASKNISENPETLKGDCQATAGITCGVIVVILWVVVVIFYY